MLDGTLIESEADDLRQWMGTHPDLLRRFPGQGLCEVLGHVLEDGDLRDLQREELSALLEQLRDSGLT
ncbi:MAG: hypothetical protein ABI877_18805 [Gemmatimonadaceae bacterium]